MCFPTQARGSKQYELTDHLGNIRTVVPDIKEQPAITDVANAGTLFGTFLPLNRLTDNDNFRLPTLTLNNYYPYGMLQAGRTKNAGGYRFGFQGQEADNKIGGLGQHLNYTFRNYDSWAIRFGAIDPLAAKYPHNSSYAFSENRVIDGVELEGLEFVRKPVTYSTIVDLRDSHQVEAKAMGYVIEETYLTAMEEYNKGWTLTGRFYKANFPVDILNGRVADFKFPTFHARNVPLGLAYTGFWSYGDVKAGKPSYLASKEVHSQIRTIMNASANKILAERYYPSDTRTGRYVTAKDVGAASFLLVLPTGSDACQFESMAQEEQVNLLVSYMQMDEKGNMVFSKPELLYQTPQSKQYGVTDPLEGLPEMGPVPIQWEKGQERAIKERKNREK